MRFHVLVELGLTVKHFRAVAALEVLVVHVFDMVFHSLWTDLMNCRHSLASVIQFDVKMLTVIMDKKKVRTNRNFYNFD